LTRCLVSSILAINSRTPSHSPAAAKGSFDNAEVGVTEGEPVPPLISPKEVSKARVAAYKKAIEDAAKATAAAENAVKAAVAVEDTPAEPSDPINLDSDDENNSDDDAYAAFEDINDIKAIGVEDKGDFVLD
jgi:sugar phosphate isomerase/epimerase